MHVDNALIIIKNSYKTFIHRRFIIHKLLIKLCISIFFKT